MGGHRTPQIPLELDHVEFQTLPNRRLLYSHSNLTIVGGRRVRVFFLEFAGSCWHPGPTPNPAPLAPPDQYSRTLEGGKPAKRRPIIEKPPAPAAFAASVPTANTGGAGGGKWLNEECRAWKRSDWAGSGASGCYGNSAAAGVVRMARPTTKELSSGECV